MVLARGGVPITLREIPNYGIVVVDSSGEFPEEAGTAPFLLAINEQSIAGKSLQEIRHLLCGAPGTPVTLDILSSNLSFHQSVTLLRTYQNTPLFRSDVSRILEKCLEHLDTLDSNDWPAATLRLAEQPSNTLFEPITSSLFEAAMKLSKHWVTPNSFVHLFTHISAAQYFDRIHRTTEANLAISEALEFLPEFDCLDFDEAGKLFEFVEHLIASKRLAQARILVDKLLKGARNSVDSVNKTFMALRLSIKIDDSQSLIALNELAEKAQLEGLPEDLNFIGDLYTAKHEYRKATEAYSSSILQRIGTEKSEDLRTFIQPHAYHVFIESTANEQEGDETNAQKILTGLHEFFKSKFSSEQIALLNDLPLFFPKPQDIEARLSGRSVEIPNAKKSQGESDFHEQIRQFIHEQQVKVDENFDDSLDKLLTQAATEDEPIESESTIWLSLIDLAQHHIKHQRTEDAYRILELVSQQTQALNFPPMHIPASLTELAILCDQTNQSSALWWLGLETLLLKFFDQNVFMNKELSLLHTSSGDTLAESTRARLLGAMTLRMWSQAYLYRGQYSQAEIVLLRALKRADEASFFTGTNELSEAICLIYCDLAIAQISLSKLSDADKSIEIVLASSASFPGKIYQIAEAYRINGHTAKAEALLALSMENLKVSSPLLRRKNYSESVFHVWKLAYLSPHHNQFLDQARRQFPSSALPPMLAYMSGEHAYSQAEYYQAARNFRAASRFPKDIISSVDAAYFKHHVLLRVLDCAERVAIYSPQEIREILFELVDVARLTNRQLTIIMCRRGLVVDQSSIQQHQIFSAILKTLVAGQNAEQKRWELRLANKKEKAFQVRTELFWMQEATNELQINQIDRALTHIKHALEIYQLSTPDFGYFRPVPASTIEAMSKSGLNGEAESFLLEFTTITTSKYGEDSREECLCLLELMHFYWNTQESAKAIAILPEVLRAYAKSMIATDAPPGQNEIISRLLDLTSLLILTNRLDDALNVLEQIIQVEKHVLPDEHIDLVSTQLLKAKTLKEKGQLDLAEVIFEHIFNFSKRTDLRPLLEAYLPDYNEVFIKSGREYAAKQNYHRFFEPPPPGISQSYVPKKAREDEIEDDEWERLGTSKQAQSRYIKSVERVIEQQSVTSAATKALEHLAASYLEKNCLGQAAEIYLELIVRFNRELPKFSRRKVFCFLSLARCYTRLCMYEEVPDLIVQAKSVDPEISENSRTLDLIMSYVSVSVEAHLHEAAQADLLEAQEIIDRQTGFNTALTRDYLELMFHFWTCLGLHDKATEVRQQLDKCPPKQKKEKPLERSDSVANSAKPSPGEDASQNQPLPFAFLECIQPALQNSPATSEENPAHIFLKSLADKISENWFPPVEKEPSTLSIQFLLTNTGKCEALEKLHTSSNKYANNAAEEAILSSAPFESLPDEFGQQALFQLTFNDAEYAKDKVGVTFESIE